MVASQRKCDVDENEVSEFIQKQQTHLETALTSYLNVLALCNDHDLLIFRVVSLWFDNLKTKAATRAVEVWTDFLKNYLQFLRGMFLETTS